MVLLNTVTEEAIVSNLQNTFAKNSIYTAIGPVLLSVNPFQPIDGLYTPTLAAKYRRKQQGELAPHVFAVAEAAWKALLSQNKDQCILVSGESGAGKTEAAKRVLKYVMMAAGERSGDSATKSLSDRLLNSNPILEAMGNEARSQGALLYFYGRKGSWLSAAHAATTHPLHPLARGCPLSQRGAPSPHLDTEERLRRCSAARSRRPHACDPPGNAKTLRNDNSSRFGKYMELLFSGAGEPTGAFITHYLLER